MTSMFWHTLNGSVAVLQAADQPTAPAPPSFPPPRAQGSALTRLPASLNAQGPATRLPASLELADPALEELFDDIGNGLESETL